MPMKEDSMQDAVGFFDRGPYGSTYDPKLLNRVNERYKRIIAHNIHLIKDKRVIDLAAHDGRWTWAALQSGAAYVDSVEGRSELVAAANKTLSTFPKERYSFVQGDIIDHIERRKGVAFDTVLCLGIFYHINEHFRLLQLMAGLKPSAIILDTALMTTKAPQIGFATESTGSKLNAIPGREQADQVLVGTMSRGLLELWCSLHKWKLAYIPWVPGEIPNHADLEDYFSPEKKARARFTCLLTPD
jgi:hypothetical protein